MERDNRIPRSSGPIALEDDEAADESSYSISLLVTQRGFALSDSEKAETLSDNLGTQFQPVTETSAPAVIEMVDVALKSYFLIPASRPHVTIPDQVHAGMKVSKSARLLQRTVSRTGH